MQMYIIFRYIQNKSNITFINGFIKSLKNNFFMYLCSATTKGL